MVHRFEGIATCLPTGNHEYAWLLTKAYDSSLIAANVRKLAPEGVYLGTQYGEILPANKPISGDAKINKIWRVPGFPFRLWAASQDSIFLIDVPHNNNVPLVDQVSVKPAFAVEGDEIISTFAPVANSRSAWLTTSHGGGKSNSLYLVDGDSPTRPKSVQLPEGMTIHGITSAPGGNSAWVAWQKPLDSYDTQSGAIFLENKRGVTVAREPIVWPGHAKGSLAPIVNGALAWRIDREPLRQQYFAGANPALVSSDGRTWSVADLFPGSSINYAVRENTGDDLPLWAWVENKPGIYLIEATNDGPRIRKKLIDDVLPKSLVPSPDGTSAWVLKQNGRTVYRIGIDGSAQRFDLPIEPEVQASVVVTSPNGQKAWVAVAPGQSKVCSLFFLDHTSEQRLRKCELTPMAWEILPAPDNSHAFVVDSTPFYIKEQFKELKHYVLREDRVQNDGEPLLTFDGTQNRSLSVGDAPAWSHDGESRCWVIRWKKGAVTSASISFNNAAELSYREGHNEEQKAAWSLAPGAKTIENVKVELSLEGQRSPKDDDGSVRISFLDTRSRETIDKTPEVKLRDSDVVQLNWPHRLNRPYEIELTFRDAHGTKSVIRWSNVEFKAPLWQRPWVRTLFVFLVLCGLSYATVAIRPTEHALRRWVPLLLMLSGGTVNFLGTISGFGIDTQLFTRLFAVFGVVLLALAWFFPKLYRALAKIEPFHKITPYLLRWRTMRKRVFLPYTRELRRWIEDEKLDANNEDYTPIPATLQERGSEARTVANPAEEIAKLVTNVSGSKPAVLVEAPGGTGKSALLREVITQSLTRFEKDPRVPLPIRCEGTGSLEDMAFAALTKHAISRDTLAAQFEMGHFFLVIDGPQDRKMSADQIRDWVRSEKGETAALLIASRPRDDIQANVRSAEHWRLVTPQRLTDETLDVFQEVYVKGGPKLTAQQKDLCRASDGSYLPILIRLALLVGPQNIDSIAELYRNTFRALLRDGAAEESGLLAQTEVLCVETYWDKGFRTIEYAEAGDERLQLLKQLKNAGVLVPADLITSKREPREVRFFHDSMQSYLTARGLLHGNTPWSETLIKAAGDPHFRDSEQGDGSEFSSELFRMCLQVFGPRERLQETLENDLFRWAEAHRKNLTRNDVERALPPAVVTELNTRVSADAGAGVVLSNAVTLIKASSNSSTVEELGRLYARIAEKVWALEPRQT